MTRPDLITALTRLLGDAFALLTKKRAPTLAASDNTDAKPAGAGRTGNPEAAGNELLPGLTNPAPPASPTPVAVARELAPVIAAAPALVAAQIDLPSQAPPLAPVALAADRSAASEQPPQVSVDSAPPAHCPVPAADPELDRLRMRVASMETKVIDLASRKAEMEQLLDEYAFRQYQAVGDLLGEQLRLQLELLQLRAERSARPEDRQAAAAAAEEYAAYQRARQEPAKPPVVLAEDDGNELTALYRAAVMRCHPDRVGEAEKTRAHELFLRTQDAYRRRDLAELRLISSQLAAADRSVSADGSTPRERLDALLESLEDKGVEFLLAIESMQMQAQYRRARCREQWDDYFAALRDSLDDECTALRRQIARNAAR